MKLKGINQFEQHVEKILLGTAVLIAAAIVARQLLWPPEVKLGSQSVSHGDVDRVLVQRATALKSKLNGDTSAGTVSLDDVTTSAVAPEFERALRGDIAPTKSLALTAPNFNGRLVTAASGNAAESWYFVPKIPALQMRGVSQTADALPAEAAKAAKAASPVIAARPEFAEIDGPRDIVWTTPSARIDLKSLRAALAQSDPSASPPLAAVPGVWFQETPYIVDVVFERRERRPDGSWGDAVTVPVFADRPGELSFRDRLSNPPIELRDEVFALLGNDANQREILQPAFYDTINDAFVSPAIEMESGAPGPVDASTATQDLGAARRRLQLRTEMQRKQRQADVLRAELDKLGGPWDDEAERRREKEEEKRKKEQESDGGGGGGGGLPGGGGGGLGGAMGGKNNQEDANAARDEKKRQQERKTKSLQLKRFLSDIAAIEKELGVEPSVSSASPAAAKPVPLSAMDEFLVWAHDMEVIPGQEYQYRCVAKVYNPFFGKGNQLVRDQDASGISSVFTLDSVASEWSSPVTVLPKVRFFVSRSSTGDGGMLGAGSAQLVIFVLQDGRWREENFSVVPGDRIGGIKQKDGKDINFTTDYFLVDVVEDHHPGRSSGASAGKKLGIAVVAPIGGGPVQVRIPSEDMASPERLQLSAQAEAAAMSAASGQGDAKPGSPAGPAGG